MTTTFRRAERRKAKLRLGISGAAGSGKTYSALLIAFGLGGRVALIDTENGSGDLYAHLGPYDVLQLGSPYTPDRYVEAIRAAEREGYDTIIIDSLSHAWAGEGGVLDMQGRIADSGKGNGFAAWRTVTPKHNALVEAMLQSGCHVIATLRAKTEYVQERDQKGGTVIRKVGLAPVQRDGLEYEFTVVLDLGADHSAHAGKDRTGLFDGTTFRPGQDTGRSLLGWLAGSGKPAGGDEAWAEANRTLWRAACEACEGLDRDAVATALSRLLAARCGATSSRDVSAEKLMELAAELQRQPELLRPAAQAATK
jgi:hypothetical protein